MLLAACGSAHAPAPACLEMPTQRSEDRPASAYDPLYVSLPPCTLTTLPRPDGLFELVLFEGDCPAEIRAAWDWLIAAPNRMVVGTIDGEKGPVVSAPLIDVPDGTLVIEPGPIAIPDTEPGQVCVGPGDRIDSLAYDLPLRTPAMWVETDATELPVKIVYGRPRGGCSFVLDGSDVVVSIDGAAQSRTVDASAEHDVTFELEGGDLIVHAPFGVLNDCEAQPRDSNASSPAASRMIRPGYLVDRVRVPVPAARVILEPQPYMGTECE